MSAQNQENGSLSPKANANATQKKGKSGKKVLDLDNLKKDMVTDLHTIPLSDMASRLQTDVQNGLSSADAAARLERDGFNELTPPKQTPEIVKFLRQLAVGFNLLLEVGGILCLIAYLVSFPQYDTWQNAPKDNVSVLLS